MFMRKPLNTEDDAWMQDVDVPKVLGDLVESVIGGVYLDSGRDLQKTWGVIRVLLGESLNHCLVDVPVNCVRQLIELVGEVLPTLPKFKKVPRLKNDKNAKYLVKIDGLPDVCGKGKNYRTAKIAAAKLAIRKFRAHMSEWNMLPEYASSASQ
nr:endoribonuclease dcr-1-like [Cherax quadricarinatus]